MNLKNWFRSIPERVFRRYSGFGSYLYFYSVTPGHPISPPKNFVEQVEKYRRNSTEKRCIDEIAEAVASLTWRDRESNENDAHSPLLDLINKPNPFKDTNSLIGTFVRDYLISGDSYINWIKAGSIHELHRIRPDGIQVIPDDKGYIQQYRIAPLQFTRREWIMPFEEIINLKGYTALNDYYGDPPGISILTQKEIDTKMLLWNLSIIEKGGKPSGILMTDMNLTDEQFSRLKTELEEEHTGETKAGMPMITEGGMKWQQTSLSPTDLDWLAGRAMMKEEIAMAHGVPSEVIGLKEGTYENRREAFRVFYLETILPLAEKIASLINHASAIHFNTKDYQIIPDKDSIGALQEDLSKRWERLENSAWLTKNEKRLETGYKEKEGGDEFDEKSIGEGWGMGEGGPSRPRPGQQHRRQRGPSEREFANVRAVITPIETHFGNEIAVALLSQRDNIIGQIKRNWQGALDSGQHDARLLVPEWPDKLKVIARPKITNAFTAGTLALGMSFEDEHIAGLVHRQIQEVERIEETTRSHLDENIEHTLRLIHEFEIQDTDASREALLNEIDLYFDWAKDYRAGSIARTEIHRAYNQGRVFGMEFQGFAEHAWVDSEDERVRDEPYNHRIGGEIRRIGEPFSNGLRWPYDIRGATGNVIGCRCFTIPVPKTRITIP